MSKRHKTANGNTGYPSCFRIGFTCFCDVSVYGFLEFRPVLFIRQTDAVHHSTGTMTVSCYKTSGSDCPREQIAEVRTTITEF